jgi:ubiquinone/menaquinone biosynthesis C-methylase UbiE
MPFDHFNLVAGLYDRTGPFRVTESLHELLSLSSNNLLLDVGGGTGRVAMALRGMVKHVFVVDVSNGMLRRAAGKGLASILAPAESLPFPPGSFDRIIMVDALHHVLDQRQTASELWRVLAPGGRVLIIEPDIRKAYVKLIALGEKILLMRSHFLTGEEIISLFEDLDVKGNVVYEEFNVFLSFKKDY